MSSYKEAEGVELLKLLYVHPDAPIAVDTETDGLHVAGGFNKVIGISIATVIDGKGYTHYYAIAHETGENIGEKTRDQLRWVLAVQPRTLIFANVQFDVLGLLHAGIDVQHQDFVDILTMANMVNENRPRMKSLDNLAAEYLGDDQKVKDEFVEKEKLTGNHNVTPEQEFEYAAKDAELTFRIWMELKRRPEWLELPDHIWRWKQDTIRVLMTMRERGILIDQRLCREKVAQGESEMKRIARELGFPGIPKKPTKRYPNPDPDPLPVMGPKVMSELFLVRLGLPIVKLTPGKQPSFDKETMEIYDSMLEDIDSPEAKLIKAYRGWQKTVSASYRAYLELVDGDGYLRCNYKTHGTVTGRLSCEQPNLQQIPKESDKVWNGDVKKAFVARPGWTLVNADYSQLELRLGTAYAQEESLMQVFAEGRDIFTEMSKELGWDRQHTKTFVYSIQYGAGVTRVKNVFGISAEEARRRIKAYYDAYPRFRRLNDFFDRAVQRDGKVKLWSGRVRHFQYASESYKAMNSVIQGGAADIVERVMHRCMQELDEEDRARMLLQVHDSLTWEVRDDYVEEFMPKLKAMMEDLASAVGHHDFDHVTFAVEVDLWPTLEDAA